MIFLLVLIAGVLYALFDFFLAKTSSKTDVFLANTIFNGLGAALPFLVYWYLKMNKQETPTTKEGVYWSILAGVTIAIFSVLLVKIFAAGGSLGFVLPTIYGIAIVVGSLLGYIFLKEQLPLMQIVGIILTVTGIVLVGLAKA